MLSLTARAQTDDNHPQFPCPYDSAHFSWRKPVPHNRLRPLRPDRPGTTESPFTLDAGHFQVETDGVRLINQPASGEDAQQRTWYVADALLKLGLGRKTDIQVELPLYSAQKQRATDTGDWENHRGFGDVAVRLKHNFLGDDQKGPIAASVVAYVRVPTGAGGVSETRPEYGLILPVNVEVGDTYNLEAQLETDLDYDPEQAQRYLRLMPSVAIDRQFGKKLGLLLEGAFPWNTEQHRWHAQLNVAPTFNVTDNFQLDAGTHIALNTRTQREYFVGFTVRY
ncbi:MAG: transporter [Janthinobacterium lividum]